MSICCSLEEKAWLMVNVLWVKSQLMHDFWASLLLWVSRFSRVWYGDECYQPLRAIIRHLICTLTRHKKSILIIHLLWPVWHFPLLCSSGISLKWFCATLPSDTRRTSKALLQVFLITLLHDEINVLLKKIKQKNGKLASTVYPTNTMCCPSELSFSDG